MRIARLFAVVLLTVPLLAQIVGITNDVGSPIVVIDPEGSTVTKVADTNRPGPLAATIDPVGKRYFTFVGGIGNQQLVSTDLINHGVSTRSIAFPEDLSALEYDVITQRILAITSSFKVLGIDPMTGASSTLFSVSPFSLTGYTAYNHAFDENGRRLFILSEDVAGSGTLVVIDVDHASSSTFPVSWNAGGYALGIQFDPVADELLAVLGAASSPLLAINTRTGASSVKLSLGVAAGGVGLTAFDRTSRRFFFLSGGDFSHIAVADIGSGVVHVIAAPASTGGSLFWNYLSATPVPVNGAAVLLLLAGGLVVVAVIRIA